MTTPKTDPWTLLREARNALSQGCWNGSCCGVRARIDAALAEVNPCRLIDVGDGGVSRERAEADAFRRGVAAMREAAAHRCWLEKDTTNSAFFMRHIIRALTDPEDKP